MLVKTQIPGPHLRVSDSVQLERGLRICITSKCLGTATTGVGDPPSENHLVRVCRVTAAAKSQWLKAVEGYLTHTAYPLWVRCFLETIIFLYSQSPQEGDKLLKGMDRLFNFVSFTASKSELNTYSRHVELYWEKRISRRFLPFHFLATFQISPSRWMSKVLWTIV